MIRSLIILLLFEITSLSLLGQVKQHEIELSPFVGRDFILTSGVDYPFTANGVHAKHINQSSQNKEWQQYFNLPRTGQELLFAQYSSNGYSVAINTFIEFDFLKSSKHNVYVSPSLGLAYTSETSITLPEYELTSLPINASVKVEFGYRYRFSENWKMATGYILSHYSNGNTSSPNDGVNMKAWKLGINYSFGDNYSPQYSTFEKPRYRMFFGQVSIGGGVKNRGGKQYSFVNGFVNAGVSFHPYHRLVAGLGIFTDKGFSESLQPNHYGVSVGYQILIGKVGFTFQPGWYLEEYFGATRYYILGLQYSVKPRLFVQANLRTSQSFFSEDLSIGIGVEF